MRANYLFQTNGGTLRAVRQCGSRQARVSARREERAASVVRNCICASFLRRVGVRADQEPSTGAVRRTVFDTVAEE